MPPGALQLSSLGASLGRGSWLPSGPCVQPTDGSHWPDGSGWLQGPEDPPRWGDGREGTHLHLRTPSKAGLRARAPRGGAGSRPGPPAGKVDAARSWDGARGCGWGTGQDWEGHTLGSESRPRGGDAGLSLQVGGCGPKESQRPEEQGRWLSFLCVSRCVCVYILHDLCVCASLIMCALGVYVCLCV